MRQADSEDTLSLTAKCVVSFLLLGVANPAFGGATFSQCDINRDGAINVVDVQDIVNEANAVTIAISAVGVPIGTVVTLNVQSELGPDQNISCTPLVGALAASTATCSASFPTSMSRILASAIW
jgi:hypothetical protein